MSTGYRDLIGMVENKVKNKVFRELNERVREKKIEKRIWLYVKNAMKN